MNRQQATAEILTCIRDHGGATIFWLTANQQRASVVDHLLSSGKIIRHREDRRDRYPWCVFSIAEAKPDANR